MRRAVARLGTGIHAAKRLGGEAFLDKLRERRFGLLPLQVPAATRSEPPAATKPEVPAGDRRLTLSGPSNAGQAHFLSLISNAGQAKLFAGWAEQGMDILEMVNTWNRLPPEARTAYGHHRWLGNLSLARGHWPQTRCRVKGMIARGRKLLEAERQREGERDQPEAKRRHEASTKRSRGRPAITIELAKFADNHRRRKPPTSWQDIRVAWLVDHPSDTHAKDCLRTCGGPSTPQCNHTLYCQDPEGTWEKQTKPDGRQFYGCKLCGRFYGYCREER
jgi:hypothetical protein